MTREQPGSQKPGRGRTTGLPPEARFVRIPITVPDESDPSGERTTTLDISYAPEAVLKGFVARRRRIKATASEWDKVFVDLWRRALRARARLRRARTRSVPFWSTAELRSLIDTAIAYGTTWERLMWQFGGPLGTLQEHYESRYRRLASLKEANRRREAGLKDGLSHKVELLLKEHRTSSRRSIARHLLAEKEHDSRRCHDCQRYEWATANGEAPTCRPCEFYERHKRCARNRTCERCIDAHAYLHEWQRDTRRKLSGISEREIHRRMCESLAKRIGKVDPRRPRPFGED